MAVKTDAIIEYIKKTGLQQYLISCKPVSYANLPQSCTLSLFGAALDTVFSAFPLLLSFERFLRCFVRQPRTVLGTEEDSFIAIKTGTSLEVPVFISMK